LGNGDWGDCIMCDSDSDDEGAIKRCVHSRILDDCDTCSWSPNCISCGDTGIWEDSSDELDCPMCR
jgi:hypothetical protein